jgi:hypothetical protein
MSSNTRWFMELYDFKYFIAYGSVLSSNTRMCMEQYEFKCLIANGAV